MERLNGGDGLPSLSARNPSAGLAPLNTSSVRFPKQDELGHGPVPRSSHGSRQNGQSQRTHGGTSTQQAGLHIGKLPQPLLGGQGQPPLPAPVSGSHGSQSSRHTRSSGGPRSSLTQSGALTARPSSKGQWSAQKEIFGAGDRNLDPGGEAAKERDKEKEKEKAAAAQQQLPLTPAKVLKAHMAELSEYEQGEILDFPQVWYWGAGAEKVRGISNAANNHGYDDERGDYSIVLHDHILYRYEVMSPLGKGSFGQVVRAYDNKTKSYVALKMIRNKKRFHHQALVEVKILEHIREHDVESTSNVVHLSDYFYFRNHLCITFELLSINLYEFIKNNNFQGVSLGLIRRFAIQLLAALRFFRKQHIIHCDLKPENVLLKNPTKSGIKVIDVGSACFEDERVYTYIQSRFYRSPEVILGVPYDVAIDMWSFGCILAELYTGYPLFPGENEVEQFACIMELLGMPPQKLLDSATRTKMFFDSNDNPRLVPNSRGKVRKPGHKDLQAVLRTTDLKFVDFLTKCLLWHPRERLTPEEALQHDWILEGYARHAMAQRDPLGAAAPSSQSRRLVSSHQRSSGGQGGHGSTSHRSAGSNAQALTAALGATVPSGGFGVGGSQPDAGGGAFMFPPIDSATSGGGGGMPMPPISSSKTQKSSRSQQQQLQHQDSAVTASLAALAGGGAGGNSAVGGAGLGGGMPGGGVGLSGGLPGSNTMGGSGNGLAFNSSLSGGGHGGGLASISGHGGGGGGLGKLRLGGLAGANGLGFGSSAGGGGGSGMAGAHSGAAVGTSASGGGLLGPLQHSRQQPKQPQEDPLATIDL
eukprot:TRINITY_DN110711_c0_g1_i1.p1 TRINITY_DN110711_c0_g1~~TRINITY_DN110711_c0_g1_i1.p1  ORF type:complete len:813 (+),score=189.41 TRINITY_DN110711_c0_g1_i1:91-2529(+)